jgi:hypothetical protein
MSFNSSCSSLSSTKTNKSSNTTVEEIFSKFKIKHTHFETLTDSNFKNKNDHADDDDDDDDGLNHLLEKYKSQDECSLTLDTDNNNNLSHKYKIEDIEQIKFLSNQTDIKDDDSRGIDILQGSCFILFRFSFRFFLINI